VLDVAWAIHQRAFAGLYHFLVELEAKVARDDVEELVLCRVEMQRVREPLGHAELDDREVAVGLLGCGFKDDEPAVEPALLASVCEQPVGAGRLW
jgi:hypothetical protein